MKKNNLNQKKIEIQNFDNLIINKVDDFYTKNINKKEEEQLKKINNITKILIPFLIVFLFVFLLMFLIYLMFKISPTTINNFIETKITWKVFYIFLGIEIATVFLFSTILAHFYKKKREIIDDITEYFKKSETIIELYQECASIVNPKLIITEINKNFDYSTKNFLINHEIYNKEWNGQFFHGNFKEKQITIGSKIIEKTKYKHHEYLYVTSNIKNINCEITLKKEAKKFNNNEFFNQFNINSTNNSSVQKILQPKVIENLLNLSKNNQKEINISLLNDKIFLAYPLPKKRTWEIDQNNYYFVNKNWKKLNVHTTKINKKIKKSLTLMIKKDLETINDLLKWIEAFNLHLDEN